MIFWPQMGTVLVLDQWKLNMYETYFNWILLILTEVGVFSSTNADRTIMVNADEGTDDDSCGTEDEPCASLMLVISFCS